MISTKYAHSPLLVALLVGTPALAQQAESDAAAGPAPAAVAQAEPVGDAAPAPAPAAAPAPVAEAAPVAEPAPAEPMAADAGFAFSTAGDNSADATMAAPPPAESHEGYMSRYKPEANLFEIGLFGGAMLPSETHNLQDEDLNHRQYDWAAVELGIRGAYFPLDFLGVELEGAVLPTDTVDGEPAAIWAARGHLIAQLPLYSVVPFVLAGGGALGVNSDTNGDDTDPSTHFGVGVKVPFDELVSMRLDLRDTLAQKDESKNGKQTNNPELLLGVTFTLDRTDPTPPPPPDADADGIVDTMDQCPGQPGPAPTGCPPPPDMDGDGIVDAEDQCPTEAGPAPEGCPPPPDSDGDGIIDSEDECPNVASQEPNGCPNLDPDGDGIPVDVDACPDQPETKNGYQDQDGCPDEIPEAVQKFTGVIEGIEFNFGSATVRPASKPVLDEAASTLVEHESLRVLITGHTDNVGTDEANRKLSQERADSVKAYLVEQGVADDRIVTKGMGPDAPLVDNDTAANRQKNRRIEFKIITD